MGSFVHRHCGVGVDRSAVCKGARDRAFPFQLQGGSRRMVGQIHLLGHGGGVRLGNDNLCFGRLQPQVGQSAHPLEGACLLSANRFDRQDVSHHDYRDGIDLGGCRHFHVVRLPGCFNRCVRLHDLWKCGPDAGYGPLLYVEDLVDRTKLLTLGEGL